MASPSTPSDPFLTGLNELDDPKPRPSRLSLLPERLSRLSLADMRRSLLSIPVWKPRWQPWSPARVVLTTLAFGAAMALVVLLGRKVSPTFRAATTRWMAPLGAAVEPMELPGTLVEIRRADGAFDRENRSPQMSGGIMTIPPAFSSPDGAYDLVIHFHGNPDLVEESFAVARVNAVVVVLNLGNGSGVYEDRFADARSLPDVLERVQTTMIKRGLANARLRRLGLTAWSAGYGAVMKVLDQPSFASMVDAVILLDGIHIGYKTRGGEMWLVKLAPFERFAQEAVAGKKLFFITHSAATRGRTRPPTPSSRPSASSARRADRRCPWPCCARRTASSHRRRSFPSSL